MPRLLSAFVLWLVVLPAALWAQQSFETSDLTIETANGGRYDFVVEMAVTPQQQGQGLMNRAEMAPDAGMLFPFDPPRVASFWMKNTLISLDMLFVDETGRIVRIAERTTPMSTESVPSGGPVRAVLELNGGVTELLGIAPGDRVVHEIFETP